MKKSLLVTLVLVLAVAAPCRAGLFSNFFGAVSKSIMDYQKDLQSEGEAIKGAFSGGQGLGGALMAWQGAQQTTGNNAKANLKEIAKGMLDFVYFIPRLIEKAWNGFCSIIKELWQMVFGGGGGGEGGPQAPGNSFAPKASDTEGDGDFVAAFEAKEDLGERLGIYTKYRSAYLDMENPVRAYVERKADEVARSEGVKADEVQKGQNELRGRAQVTADALNAMEDSLARDIAGSDEKLSFFQTYRRALDVKTRYRVLPTLNMKVLELRQ